MSPTNAKALNTMKQRLRKYLPEFEAGMAAWRENPVLDEEAEEEESEEESEEEAEDGDGDEDGLKRRVKKRVRSLFLCSVGSVYFGEILKGWDRTNPPLKSTWLGNQSLQTRFCLVASRFHPAAIHACCSQWHRVLHGRAIFRCTSESTMARTAQYCRGMQDELLTMDPEKITYEMVSDKARYIAQARGKRGTDRQEQLEMLQFLSRVAKGPVQRIEVGGLRCAVCCVRILGAPSQETPEQAKLFNNATLRVLLCNPTPGAQAFLGAWSDEYFGAIAPWTSFSSFLVVV